MVRRLITLLAFVGVLIGMMTAMATAAEADTAYPAPPITSAQVFVTDPVSMSVTPVGFKAAASADPLAYTGVPFNVTYVVGVALLVVLVGVMLVALGGRRAWKHRPHHGRG